MSLFFSKCYTIHSCPCFKKTRPHYSPTTLHSLAGFPDGNRSNQLVIKALQTLACDVITSKRASKESGTFFKNVNRHDIPSDSYLIIKHNEVDYSRKKNSINVIL